MATPTPNPIPIPKGPNKAVPSSVEPIIVVESIPAAIVPKDSIAMVIPVLTAIPEIAEATNAANEKLEEAQTTDANDALNNLE